MSLDDPLAVERALVEPQDFISPRGIYSESSSSRGRAGGDERLGSNVEAIEEFFRRRYGGDALVLPSGRLALYIAFREWLAPGDRILMSPVDDDVVFFTVLAAGLVPVLGPIDPDTGNLDPKAIDDATWSRLRAVLTTNLYGIPDAMEVLEERCHRHGLILFEDACQAFDTRVDGKRIGTFGTAAAFSLGKHLEIPGGVLVFPDSSRRDSLQRRAREALRTRPHSAVTAYKALTFLTAVGGPGWAPRWLGHLVGQGVLPSDRWRGHRMPYDEDAVRNAIAGGGGLDRFDHWVRMDDLPYRTPLPHVVLAAALHRLERFDEDRPRLLAGVQSLLDLGYIPPQIRIPRDTVLLRVPLFVEDRERVLAQLARRGHGIQCIYDPPLDEYAPAFAEQLPSPPSRRIWSRDVLPVNPRRADRFLALRQETPSLFRPIGADLSMAASRPTRAA